MKVLHSIWSAGFGGIEKLALDLAEAQTGCGLEPSLLISRDAGELLTDFGKAFPDYRTLGLAGGWDLSPAKYRRALAICKAHDIVHIHTYNPLVARAAVHSGKTIVYHEHGNFGQKRKRTLADVVKKALLTRLLNGPVSCVVFNSEWTRMTAEKRYGLTAVAKRVIYNGIPLGSHSDVDPEQVRQIRSRYDGAFIVGTTSRFAGFKRVDRLIEAFALFCEGRDAVLLLVGDGILRQEYEEQVRRLGIGEKTVFTGYRHDVALWQSAMDVCVFPSESEPFGLVAVEALSLGKPVIVLGDAGGMKEIIEPMEPRDVVPDIPSLAARIGEYWDNRGKIDGAGKIRIARAGEFDIAAMARATKDLYKSLPGVKAPPC